MADKDAKVVHPDGGKKHIVIERLIFSEAAGDLVKARLVAEFIRWFGLDADVFTYCVAVIRCRHGSRLMKTGPISTRCKNQRFKPPCPPTFWTLCAKREGSADSDDTRFSTRTRLFS